MKETTVLNQISKIVENINYKSVYKKQVEVDGKVKMGRNKRQINIS